VARAALAGGVGASGGRWSSTLLAVRCAVTHLCPSNLDAQRSRWRRSGADVRRWEVGASGGRWRLLAGRAAPRAVTHLCPALQSGRSARP